MASEELSPPVKVGSGIGVPSPPAVMIPDEPIPIQDGRDVVKAQNGLGIGSAGDPAYTLDTLGAQAVMAPFVKVIRPASDQHPEVWREEQTAPTLNSFDNAGESRATVLACGFKGGQSDGGIGWEEETSPTLNSQMSALEPTVLAFSQNQRGELVETEYAHQLTTGGGKLGEGYPAIHIPALTASNDPSRSPQSSEITQQVAAMVAATAQVRRLTPTECERLMGWPDGHTATRADGSSVADSTRYRMCGNGVVSNVAEWIAGHIATALEEQ